jgi:CRISPR system Cascade subunit CasC
MVADDHTLMLEGAGLFSHALSTHQVSSEIDFFSAVDEEPDSEGAGHIGTLEFNSACYYRYIGINLDLLKDNDHLGHFADQDRNIVIEAFLKAAVLAVPEARKNSMSGLTLPSYVLGLRKHSQPLSLANAFETPIKSSAKGYE